MDPGASNVGLPALIDGVAERIRCPVDGAEAVSEHPVAGLFSLRLAERTRVVARPDVERASGLPSNARRVRKMAATLNAP